MTEAGTTMSAPKHLLIVGIVALLWNAVGAYDYLMTVTENEAHLSAFTPEQLEYFTSFPLWAVSTWAIAVWGAVLGSILLIVKKRWATPVFLVSLVAMIITTIYNFGLSDGLEVMGGPAELAFSAVIFIVAVALYLYARAMERKGALS